MTAVASPAAELDSSHEIAVERFHRCPADPACTYCGRIVNAAERDRLDWSFVDAVYCISLETRPDRAAHAMRELHRVGLCRQAVFYRPPLMPFRARRNIWASHRAVALHARARDLQRVLILEDDVTFSFRNGARTLRKVAESSRRLPVDWMGFYLGHWPLRGHFVHASILRSASLCTHAYIASERLIQWLCDNSYENARPRDRSLRRFLGGAGIDAAYSRLAGMYAFFPMVAFQNEDPGDHELKGSRAQRSWIYALRLRLRETLLLRHMRTAERVAVATSPIDWVVTRLRARARSGSRGIARPRFRLYDAAFKRRRSFRPRRNQALSGHGVTPMAPRSGLQ